MGKRKIDRELGMDRQITRRDFLNGVAIVTGATLAAGPLRENCLRRAYSTSLPLKIRLNTILRQRWAYAGS
jgi:hypothetical protein